MLLVYKELNETKTHSIVKKSRKCFPVYAVSHSHESSSKRKRVKVKKTCCHSLTNCTKPFWQTSITWKRKHEEPKALCCPDFFFTLFFTKCSSRFNPESPRGTCHVFYCHSWRDVYSWPSWSPDGRRTVLENDIEKKWQERETWKERESVCLGNQMHNNRTSASLPGSSDKLGIKKGRKLIRSPLRTFRGEDKVSALLGGNETWKRETRCLSLSLTLSPFTSWVISLSDHCLSSCWLFIWILFHSFSGFYLRTFCAKRFTTTVCQTIFAVDFKLCCENFLPEQ